MLDKLEESLVNGNSAFVIIEKDGQNSKMFIETIPRFRNGKIFLEANLFVKP